MVCLKVGSRVEAIRPREAGGSLALAAHWSEWQSTELIQSGKAISQKADCRGLIGLDRAIKTEIFVNFL